MRARPVVAALAMLMLVLGPAAARAQGQPEWGVRGGLSLSSLRGDRGSFDSKLGLTAGAFGVYDLATDFRLEGDALFSMKGARDNGPTATNAFVILDYVETMVLARYDVPTEGTVVPHFVFGPTAAILVSGRYRGDSFGSRSLPGTWTLESGLAAGAGIDLGAGSHKIVLDARYVLGDRHYNAPNVEAVCAQAGRVLVTTRYGPYPHTDGGVEVRRVFHKLRSLAIENFNEHFKGIFDGHGQVPTKGLVNTQRFSLGAIFVYQLALLHRWERGLELCVGLKAFLKAA